MTFTRIVFPEIVHRVSRSGKCRHCGKRRSRQEKLWSTVNPFNKNEDGSVKSEKDVRRALQTEAAAWYAAPFLCAKCDHETWIEAVEQRRAMQP
jgi:hypothetical protein